MTNADQERAAVKPVKLAKVCNVLQTLLIILFVSAFLLSRDMLGLIKIAGCFVAERCTRPRARIMIEISLRKRLKLTQSQLQQFYCEKYA